MGKIIRGVFRDSLLPSGKTAAIIPCAGKGSRMGLDFNKIFLSIEDKPVISYTLDIFEDCPLIDEVIIPAAESDIPLLNEIIDDFEYKKVKSIVRGGQTRQESIKKALGEISDGIEFVAIHDGARPLLPPSVLYKTVEAGIKYGAAATGIMSKDTLKTVKNGKIEKTLDRSTVALIQTPQVFKKELLISAHQTAEENNITVTDDASLIENINEEIVFVEGSSLNIKLTTPEDYLIISSYLRGETE